MNPVLEILVFTLNAIVIYLLADWILRRIEARRGEVLKSRQAVFFVIILVLALVSFQVLKSILAAAS
jgi:predicted PurR-regulated permease PerM